MRQQLKMPAFSRSPKFPGTLYLCLTCFLILLQFSCSNNTGTGGTTDNYKFAIIDPKNYICYKITHKSFEDAIRSEYSKFILNTGIDDLADPSKLNLYYCNATLRESSAPMLAGTTTDLAGDIPTTAIIGNNELVFTDYYSAETGALMEFAYIKLCPVLRDNYLSWDVTVWSADGDNITGSLPRVGEFPEGVRWAKPSPPAPPAE